MTKYCESSRRISCSYRIRASIAPSGGGLPRCSRVVLVRVKKARNPLLQLRRLARLGRGYRVLEEALLDGSRQTIPLQENGRPEALQDTLLSRGEGHGLGAARFLRCRLASTSFALPSVKGAGQRIPRIHLASP